MDLLLTVWIRTSDKPDPPRFKVGWDLNMVDREDVRREAHRVLDDTLDCEFKILDEEEN